MALRFEYRFHPVGQGLFSSHVIYEDDRPRFWWVYDCGTSSPFNNLRAQIEKLRADVESEQLSGSIDFVFISHFDADHINGLVLLLEHFNIKNLVLPYIPQWQRLIIALERGVSLTSEIGGFFINPVSFLRSVAPDGIGRIFFVPPRNDGDEVDGTAIVERASPPSADWSPSYSTLPEEDFAQANGLDEEDGIAVSYLNPSYPITIAGVWEFIPYNDERFSPKKSSFRSNVKRALKVILSAKDAAGRLAQTDVEVAIDTLRQEYLNEFGTSSYRRNAISLMLYSGEILRGEPRPSMFEYFLETTGVLNTVSTIEGGKGAQLLTGDGFIRTSRQLEAILDVLDGRANRLGVMQVMHHGSRANWHDGVGAAFRPLCAVFPSEPKYYGHPHPEVVTDFIGSQFAPVTEEKFFCFTGEIGD